MKNEASKAAEPPRPGEVTVILRAAAKGDRKAAAEVLPLVYNELRRLAEVRLRQTPPGNTLQPTALVHEAYLRLVGEGADGGGREGGGGGSASADAGGGWEGRGHFFGAAARAMRDILVEQARRKAAAKRGGGRQRIDLEGMEITAGDRPESMLELDDVLRRLEERDPRRAEIVMLRCFAGLTEEQTAAALGLTDRTIRREWRYAKAWLLRELEEVRGAGQGVQGRERVADVLEQGSDGREA